VNIETFVLLEIRASVSTDKDPTMKIEVLGRVRYPDAFVYG
jgi:hypothetical protein